MLLPDHDHPNPDGFDPPFGVGGMGFNPDRFRCGDESLDRWLRKRAAKNEEEGGTRTFVVCRSGTREVVGYYALATGGLLPKEATGRVRRNMPAPIPVVILCRLAVDERYHGRGIGKGLVRDAILRTLRAAESVGVRALLVHAIDDRAAKFYRVCGFRPSPVDERTLMLLLKDVRTTAHAVTECAGE